jgi:hypothetical protein
MSAGTWARYLLALAVAFLAGYVAGRQDGGGGAARGACVVAMSYNPTSCLDTAGVLDLRRGVAAVPGGAT